MLDAQLVSAAIADRAAFDIVAPHITAKDMTPHAGFWFELVSTWYATDRGAKSIDKDVLIKQGEAKAPTGKNRAPVVAFVRDLPEPPSPLNVAKVALELKRHNVNMELAAAIGGNEHKKIPALLKTSTELMAATELGAKRGKWNVAPAIGELLAATGDKARIPLAPATLNARIGGGALPGHHIVVFGRPDAGKSTFTINLGAVAAVRHKQRVLYVGNEDQIAILKRRALCRVADMTWEETETRWDEAQRLWVERGAEDRLLFAQLEGGTVGDLPEMIEQHQASVLILDQIRGLASDEDGMTRKLEANAIAVRQMLLRYGLIGVSVTQANDRSQGYNQKPPVWLDMSDIDSSRTGLPGTADLIIGIGCDDDMRARGQRMLSLPKNKCAAIPNNDGILVEFDLAKCKVK